MGDYTQGKIYKIIDESNGDVYIGSTIQTLHMRFLRHRMFNEYNKDKCNCKIILIEDYPCNSKHDLNIREQYHIDNNECINKRRAYSDDIFKKQDVNKRCLNHYYENKQERKQYMKSWRDNQKSWGTRTHNLLMIDVNLFL